MTGESQPRKLIETGIPLSVINAESAREKSLHFTVQFGVVPVFPYRHAFHQFMQSTALRILLFGCGEAFRM